MNLTETIAALIARMLDQRLPDYREVYVMRVSSTTPLMVTDGTAAHPAGTSNGYTPVGGDRVMVFRSGTSYVVGFAF